MTKVIQWATGVTGMMALRHIVGRPDLELVGVRVYDPAKSGVDAGELAGVRSAGVVTTDDRQALIDTEADVVLYMGKVETDTAGCFRDVQDLLASGKNVVATGSRFIHPPVAGRRSGRLPRICLSCREFLVSWPRLVPGLRRGVGGARAGPTHREHQPHQRA